MVAYRFYCLDGAGSIQLADWIDAATDEEAVRQARELRKDFANCEVWQKDRLVGKLNSHETSD